MPTTDPQESQQPLKQRKLNRSLPQLKRNAACLPCRRRRIKCDAGKPHCSSCVRSYHFLARKHPDEERDAKGVQCFYDDDGVVGDDDEMVEDDHDFPSVPKRGAKRKDNEQEDSQQVIQRLEMKIAELQRALETSTESSAPPSYQGPTGSGSDLSEPATASNLWPTSQNPEDIVNQVFVSATGFAADITSNPIGLDMASGPGGHTLGPSVEDGIDDEAGKMGGPFLDLLWPGWPPTLPTPAMVDHLVETFFTMVPSVPRVLHRQSFLARLALPPTHPDFPHRSLLHAICACASRYTAAVKVRSVAEGVEKYSEEARQSGGKGIDHTPGEDSCFSERNAQYTFAAFKYEHVGGQGLFDMLQAMVIIGHWAQSNARWIDGWMLIGAATRLVICLGLLDERAQSDPDISSYRRSVLGPPKDDADREARAATLYYVLCYDITSASSSGWSGTMPVDEIFTKLPGSRIDFDQGLYFPHNPQSYHSPDLFTNHPVVDSFVMFIKGKILLGRACKFTRKSRKMDPQERQVAAQLPEFRQIDGDIAAFGLSFPAALRDPVQYRQGYSKGIDADLISAHLVPHIAAIFLHEPFADLDNPWCPSTVRLLNEARACLNIVYLIVSSSADISYMVVPITSPARTLILFYQHALATSDMQLAQVYKSEIGVFKMAFSTLSTRVAMGVKHLAMLTMMEESIERESSQSAFTGPFRCDQIITVTNTLPTSGVSKHETHPDGIIYTQLKDGQGGKNACQEVLDQKRGFVGSSSRSASLSGASNGGGSNGPSPNDPLSWLSWSTAARVTMLSPEELHKAAE